jgi:hypothetical protein
MSYPETLQVECPACGSEQSVTIWRTVNVTLDPRLRTQLMDGSLSRFECTQCSHQTSIDHPLLYHDMQHGFMIFQLNREDGTQLLMEGIRSLTAAPGAEELFGSAMADYRMRVVASRNELIEKIYVFEDGLDDRMIEMVKSCIWFQIRQQSRWDTAAVLLYTPRTSKGSDDALLFTLLDGDGQAYEIPLSDIGGLMNDLSSYLAGQPPPAGWARIDRATGAELLQAFARWSAGERE